MSGSSGPYYKPMTIANDDSRVISKLETSLTGDTRVVIYDRHMFIVQATDQVFWIWVYFKIEGVELLVQKESRSISFGTKSDAFFAEGKSEFYELSYWICF